MPTVDQLSNGIISEHHVQFQRIEQENGTLNVNTSLENGHKHNGLHNGDLTIEQTIHKNISEVNNNTTVQHSTINPKLHNHTGLVKAHDTVRNILECVGKKAAVQRCSLFQMIDDRWLLVEHEWPQGHEGQYISIPMMLQHVTSDSAIIMTRDDVSRSKCDTEFFKVNDIATALFLPIRHPQGLPTTVGFLAFTSNTPREWTQEHSLLLEIARDLIRATLTYSNIFINLDDKIAHLSATEIVARCSEEQNALLDQLVVLFERVRRQSKIKDMWQSVGMKSFKNKLARFVLANQTIAMALPAFPFKNIDRSNKVIGTLPDMGEALALSNLNAFALEVSKIYPPGCKILVISDGRVFNDLYPAPDTTVSAYTHHIHSLGQGRLEFIGLDQMFSSSTDNQFKRDAIVHLYGGNIESVHRKLQEDEYFHQVYMSFKIFLLKDVGESKRSAAQKAKLMMVRNDSYSELIRLLFPHHVRLSIHDHSSLEKISVHLVGDSVITPWHGVAVKRKNGTWTIMRKKTALEMGCVLEDAMNSISNEGILHNDLKLLNLARNELFSSLPFYREI